jgi:Ca2+-binding RTX toxin-like protein
MQFDDATMSVAGNALTLVAKPNSTAVVDAVAVLDTSAVVLSSGTVTLDASTFGSILGYVGGNARETITGGTQADVFTYSTSAYLAGTDVIKGGSGADTLVLSEAAAKTITAAQLAGVSSVGTINLDGVDGNNTAAIKITLSAAVATAMAESNALTVRSLNATGAIDDTGKINIDASAVGSDVALTLTGGLGADTIKGGAGADTISGGTVGGTVGGGADTLTGGGGKDIFILTTSAATVDTITDMDFGTSSTTVDQIKVVLSYNGGFDLVSTDAIVADSDVVVLTTQAYADVAAVDVAVEALSALLTGLNADKIIVWQDTLGNVHITQAIGGDGANAGADGGDEFTLTDLGILSGVTITGVKGLIDIGDFIGA